MIRKWVLIVTLLAVYASIGLGAPVCTVGTVETYVALGAAGCQIGDKLFYDFNYLGTGSGGATPIPEAGVAVTPIDTPYNPGFTFNAPWSVGAGQALNSTIGFTVAVLDGGGLIKDISATMMGYGRVPDGTVMVAETTTVGNLLLYDSDRGEKPYDQLLVPLTAGPITVQKQISVNGFRGLATVSGVTNQFSEVPEPTSLILIGTSLLGLGFLRRGRHV